MTTSLFQRAAALCLAATVTLAMLGSIDHLALKTEASPVWAQASVQRA